MSCDEDIICIAVKLCLHGEMKAWTSDEHDFISYDKHEHLSLHELFYYYYYLLSLLCSFIHDSQKYLNIDDGARCNKFCQASSMAHVFLSFCFTRRA